MLLDIHAHTTLDNRGLSQVDDYQFATPEELIAIYDRVGIGQAILLPMVSPESNHRLSTVEETLRICAEWPDRFIPFANLDPRFGNNSPEADLRRALEFYKGLGCRGVGEATANLYFDDPRVLNLFRTCEALELPLTFHVATREGNIYGLIDERGLPRLERVLEIFPKLVFLGHSQAFWSHISGDVTEETWGGWPDTPVAAGGRVVELMERYPNLHGDLSAGSGWNAVARDPAFGYWFLERFSDRLHFGTDLCTPSQEATRLIDFLNAARDGGQISQEVYAKVGWRNSQRLLGLEER